MKQQIKIMKKYNYQEPFDIFDLLSVCKPIKHRGKYKSSKFKEPHIYKGALFLGDFGTTKYSDTLECCLYKRYYINTHQLIPYNYFANIKIPTKDIYLSRVKKNGKELMYVKNQSLEICIEAVKENVYSFDFVIPKFKLYPLYKVIEEKNPIYLNMVLKREKKSMEGLKLEYECLCDNKDNINYK
jgi:hypothetical protein